MPQQPWRRPGGQGDISGPEAPLPRPEGRRGFHGHTAAGRLPRSDAVLRAGGAALGGGVVFALLARHPLQGSVDPCLLELKAAAFAFQLVLPADRPVTPVGCLRPQQAGTSFRRAQFPLDHLEPGINQLTLGPQPGPGVVQGLRPVGSRIAAARTWRPLKVAINTANDIRPIRRNHGSGGARRSLRAQIMDGRRPGAADHQQTERKRGTHSRHRENAA